MISEALKMQVYEHIESFSKQICIIFKQEVVASSQYLPPDLYLQKFEPETYKLKQEKLPFKAKICYDSYGRLFHENFNINFGCPRKDTYKKCDILENKMLGAESEEEKKSFGTQRKAQTMF
ncbi:unnamed protein product [Psylliodes chrysocephalus]|uniref:Uncharacterized protein n=1 Tax=Psylliodes chrysocephalus TaxID=3402493 RepID=A0A9P0D166_9CUCU|nr:unnamed protein product [Psylliodes chrysocephala]